jgi:carbamoyl-phosphate synthase small subunit
MDGKLILEDGTIADGEGFGSRGIAYGELVFNTSMTGYQEALTDPSYRGQILMFTYPLIGNYGINYDDSESSSIKAEGVVVKEHCKTPSHRKSVLSLEEFLEENDIPGISEVDTRILTKKIRAYGTMKAALISDSYGLDIESIRERVKEMPHPYKANLVGKVACKEAIEHKGGGKNLIALIDCGVKKSIIEALISRSDVVQLPYDATADEIYGLEPDSVVVSNGPGDPSHPDLIQTTRTIRELANDFPMLGICLGHQLIARSFGAKTYKMKFGHRGANHPVKDLRTGKVDITTQNHGYGLSIEEDLEIRPSQINANDGTVEAIVHTELPIISVQYHPEANPGPLDTFHIFTSFFKLVEGG